MAADRLADARRRIRAARRRGVVAVGVVDRFEEVDVEIISASGLPRLEAASASVARWVSM